MLHYHLLYVCAHSIINTSMISNIISRAVINNLLCVLYSLALVSSVY